MKMKTSGQSINVQTIKKVVTGVMGKLDIPTKNDIKALSAKIDRNQKAIDQIDDVARILRNNEQNLKDLGGLKHRLSTLDKIMISVDNIAGDVQKYQQEQTLNSNTLSKHSDRLDRVEKHLHLTPLS